MRCLKGFTRFFWAAVLRTAHKGGQKYEENKGIQSQDVVRLDLGGNNSGGSKWLHFEFTVFLKYNQKDFLMD